MIRFGVGVLEKLLECAGKGSGEGVVLREGSILGVGELFRYLCWSTWEGVLEKEFE